MKIWQGITKKFKVSHLGLIRNVSKQLENKILENAAVAPSIDAKNNGELTN